MALFNDAASLNDEGLPRAYAHVYLNRAALKREMGDSRGAENDIAEYNELIR